MLPFELIKDTPYLALSGELWSVFYEYFNRNWSCYKGFLLYKYQHTEALLCIHALVFLVACPLFTARPLPKLILTYCQLDIYKHI